MRSEQEMFRLILDVAREDDRIRAVWLEGSRANPNVPKDIFQDYDIAYAVTEMDSFLANPGWIDRFGERVILQTPEDMELFPPELGDRFSYLMQFEDGNRIDLCLVPISSVGVHIREDKLKQILLDKDGILPELPPSTDEEYWVKRPTERMYRDCINEFYWVSTYVAKGLWRRELLYAMEHLNHYVRHMLLEMLSWQVGTQTGFSLSVGKCHKYLDRHLPAEDWSLLMETFAAGSTREVWRAYDRMEELFVRSAKKVAAALGFVFPEEERRKVLAYLERVRALPPDATDM